MLYSEHMEGDEGEACSATPALSLWFWLTVVNVMAIAILRMPMLEQKEPARTNSRAATAREETPPGRSNLAGLLQGACLHKGEP